MDTPQPKRNSDCVDLVKFVMSIFVVAIHAHFLGGNYITDTLVNDVIGRMAVPFFFTAAGYFLFSHANDTDFSSRVLKYEKRMFVTYCICTVIYIPAILVWNNGKVDADKWLKLFLFDGTYRQLWFLPALIFAVAIVYGLYKLKIPFGGILLISVPFYFVGCAFHSFYKPLITVEAFAEVALEYYEHFGTTRNGLFFGFIFVALGAFIATHHIKIKQAICMQLLIISTACMVLEVLYINDNAELSKGMGMCLSVFFVAFFLFVFSINTSFLAKCPSKPFKILRVLSSVIYYSHTMFLFKISGINPNLEFFIAVVCSIALGLVYVGATEIIKRVKANKQQPLLPE